MAEANVGRTDEAITLDDRGLERQPYFYQLLFHRARLGYETGRKDGDHFDARLLELAVTSEDSAADAWTASQIALGLAIDGWLRSSLDRDRRRAIERLADAAERNESAAPWMLFGAAHSRALAAVLDGDANAAHRHLHRMEELQPGHLVFLHAHVMLLAGEADEAVGRLRSRLEDLPADAAYARPWTQYELAVALLELGRAGAHAAEARQLLDSARSDAAAAGLVELGRRIEHLQQSLDVGPKRTRELPDGLTARELEVIRLLANGMTDKQIGEALFISPKTVGNHVTHVREKTRCANRAEVVRYASERSLLDSDDHTDDDPLRLGT